MSAGDTSPARSMIGYRWTDQVAGGDRSEAEELVRTAWDYDAEAGFTRVEEALIGQVGAATDGHGPVIRHLLVRGELDDLDWDGVGGPLLAYLHLVVDGDEGLVRYVVHPDHRSRGVTTMLMEEVGLEVGADGWCGSGARAVRGWALGHHPAAERFARRFGLDQLSRTWQLVRHLTGPFADPLPDIVLPGGFVLDATHAPAGEADPAEVDRLAMSSGMSEAERQQFVHGIDPVTTRLCWVRTADGTPVGFVAIDSRIATVEGRAAGTVRGIAVDAKHKRDGIGRALLAVGLADLMEYGAQLAMLRIDPSRAGAVRMTRLLSFERDKDDACYGFGDAAQRAAWLVPQDTAGRDEAGRPAMETTDNYEHEGNRQ